MFAQYPYELFQYIQTSPGGQDADGNWIPQAAEWVKVGICRSKENGNGSYITVTDGNAYVYEYLILMPEGTTEIARGTKIKVELEGHIKLEGVVKRFETKQLNSKLWV
ncbi:hypothetical protein [Dyadobacter sp. 3J3]|uniref:hypothetical protein n=1 Tax=Dyadobacter sp. 3J3 TaxID=2606600 RepID=UPI00135B0CD5|nr:hypothetical protein [Dyadobacter sp. 3J3]